MQSTSLKKNVTYLLLISILSSLFLFYNLGSFSLNHLDEGLFASIAYEMQESGDLGVLAVRDEGFFHKQPLRFWLNIFVFKYFGVSNYSARFLSAFFALCLLFTVYFLSRLIYNKAETGLLSVFILLGSPHFLFERFGRNVEEDSMGIFLVSLFFLAVLCFLKFEKKLYWYMGFFVLGLVALTKLAFAGFAFLILLCFLLAYRKNIKAVDIGGGVFVFFAVALPWHIWQYFAADINFAKIYLAEIMHFLSPTALSSDFAYEFFGEALLKRLGGKIAMGVHADVFYYFYVLAIGFFPWLFFAGLSLCKDWGCFFKKGKNFKVLPVIWALLPLIIMLFFYEKRTWRINILFPALAMLSADFIISSFYEKKRIWLSCFLLAAVFIFAEVNQYGLPFYTPCLWGEHYLNFELLPNSKLWQLDSSCVKRAIVLFICISSYIIKRVYKKTFRQNLLVGLLTLVLSLSLINSFSLLSRQTYKNDMEIITESAQELIKKESSVVVGVLAAEPTKMFYAELTPEFSDYSDRWADYFYLKILGDKDVVIANTEKDYRTFFDKYNYFIVDKQNYEMLPAANIEILKKTKQYLLVAKSRSV